MPSNKILLIFKNLLSQFEVNIFITYKLNVNLVTNIIIYQCFKIN